MDEWRQGDVLSVRELTVVGAAMKGPRRLLSVLARRHPPFAPYQEVVEALVIVTQSCDIVRSPSERPYLQVAPLVRLGGDQKAHAIKGSIPRFAAIPTLGDDVFVDLDRIMTVSKNAAIKWTRRSTALSADQARALSASIARFFGRPAFPNDFVEATDKLRKRMVDRHGKRSEEGSAVTALYEIRVRAVPSWDGAEVKSILYFIVPAEESVGIDGSTQLTEAFWEDKVRSWENLCAPKGRVKEVICVPITYADMDALTYRSSDPFDVEYLSTSST